MVWYGMVWYGLLQNGTGAGFFLHSFMSVAYVTSPQCFTALIVDTSGNN